MFVILTITETLNQLKENKRNKGVVVGFHTDGGGESLGGGGASPVTIDEYGCQGLGREELGSRLVVLV